MSTQLDFLFKKDDKKPQPNIIDWGFKKVDTQYLTHGLHPYPARMIPQIAITLMDIYLTSISNPLVVDVFCGSGTVNVEASLKGYKSIGIDINPFAVLLSRAKTTSFENISHWTYIRNNLIHQIESQKEFSQYVDLIPKYKNLNHWFKDRVIKKLSFIKFCIQSIDDLNLKNLLLIAFANTLMKSSNVDWKSSRYIRVLPKEKLKYLEPDVFQIFQQSLLNLENRIKKYSQLKRAEVQIIEADARKLPIETNGVDIIITSPPYGEERNTIPYIRWSKLFLLWLGIKDKEITDLEKHSLGGNSKEQISRVDIPSKTFWEAVKDVPENRIKEALPFMRDYLITLREMKRILKRNKLCCIVIGHRSIKRNLIDMGKVTVELASEAGLKYKDIFRRTIPKKMIPWSTPTGETIFDESIVILKK